MMLGHPDRDRRSDERSGGIADPASNDLGSDRVGADEADWYVLLGRADGQDDAPARFGVGLDLHPSLQLQLHSPFFRDGLVHRGSSLADNNTLNPLQVAALRLWVRAREW